MHIKICMDSIYQDNLSRYKELKLIKDDNRGLLNDYSQKMIYSISRLQDKSSKIVESNIQHKSKVLSSSNLTVTSDTSPFITNCSTPSENNKITPKKGSIFLLGVYNTHRIVTSNETCLTVAIADLIISEGLSFNLA